MELNFSMVDVSLAVFEAPNQIGAMHFRAYASALLHEELRNTKAFAGRRDICTSQRGPCCSCIALPVDSLPPGAQQGPSSFGQLDFLAALPMTLHGHLSLIRIFV